MKFSFLERVRKVLPYRFRIGVAFVPDQADAQFRLSETDRLKLAGQVRDAFARFPFVREIEALPSLYLESGGGFANLDRVASMLRPDVIALISYDQMQHSGAICTSRRRRSASARRITR